MALAGQMGPRYSPLHHPCPALGRVPGCDRGSWFCDPVHRPLPGLALPIHRRSPPLNWRVTFYAYGVLGTDQYPPFTLARSDYPAELDVAYPVKLSHWKVLFKSWLFALPQLLIVAALTGSAAS